jgi:hypothetical protein
MKKFWMAVALREDEEGDPIFDTTMNECLETTYYDIKTAEQEAKDNAAAFDQPFAIMQAVSVFAPQKRPVKKTTVK